MAVELATAYVSLVPSARGVGSGIQRELAQQINPAAARVGTSASKSFGGKFTSGMKSVALGVGGIFAFQAITRGISSLITAAEESIKVGKQTEAVIKSTGGVAKVSSADIGTLVDALSRKAGVDDELIQTGANVLLTFTKVRNEVGAGNDIFNQATTVALDMSTALGTDLNSSVIQLGKALNDPIKGITALRRVGVSFSQSQIDMITKLVETGDLLGAQKIILQELTTEFGGSAEAQATASGKLSVAWGNLQEELGTKLLPAVEAFSTWMIDEGIPALQDLEKWVSVNVVPALQSMWRVFHDDILPVLEDVAGFITATLAPAFGTLTDALGGSNEEAEKSGPSWQGWAVALGAVAGAAALVAKAIGALGFIVPVIKGVGIALGFLGFAATTAFSIIMRTLPFAHIITLVVIFKDRIISLLISAWEAITGLFTKGWQFVTAKWSEMWDDMSADVSRWWTATSSFFARIWSSIKSTFQAGLDWITNAWSVAWTTVKTTVTNAANAVYRTIVSWKDRVIAIFTTAITWLLQAGRNLITGLWNGIKTVWNNEVGFFTSIGTTIAGYFTRAINWLSGGGRNIIRGLWNGIKAVWEDVIDWFKDVPGKIKDALGISSPPKWMVDSGRWIMKALMKGLGWGVGKVMDYMASIAGKFTGVLKDAWDTAFGAAKEFLFGGDGGGFAGLAEPFASRLQALINASGGSITIGSGRRSRAQQAALYADWLAGVPGQARAAPPGRSKHERGFAADLRGNLSMAHRLAPMFGLRFPVRGEGWHIELGPGHTYYAKGAWRTGNELATLHAGEMVLPARIAGAVRSALRGGGAAAGVYVAPGAVVIGIPPGSSAADAERLGGAAGKGFLDVIARRRVITDARIA